MKKISFFSDIQAYVTRDTPSYRIKIKQLLLEKWIHEKILERETSRSSELVFKAKFLDTRLIGIYEDRIYRVQTEIKTFIDSRQHLFCWVLFYSKCACHEFKKINLSKNFRGVARIWKKYLRFSPKFLTLMMSQLMKSYSETNIAKKKNKLHFLSNHWC